MSLLKSSMSSKRELRSGENSEEHEGVAFSSGSVVEDRGICMHSSFGRLVRCCSVSGRLGLLVRFKLVSCIYLVFLSPEFKLCLSVPCNRNILWQLYGAVLREEA